MSRRINQADALRHEWQLPMWVVSKVMGFLSRFGAWVAAKPRPSKQFLRQQNIVRDRRGFTTFTFTESFRNAANATLWAGRKVTLFLFLLSLLPSRLGRSNLCYLPRYTRSIRKRPRTATGANTTRYSNLRIDRLLENGFWWLPLRDRDDQRELSRRVFVAW